MKLFELSEIMGTTLKAPINIDSIPRLQVPMFCQYVDNDISTGYLGKGIHFSDWSINEYYEHRLSGSIYDIQLIEYILKSNLTIDTKEKITPLFFTAFSILHEEGHWVDFNSSGLDVFQYMSGDKDYTHRKKVQDFANYIRELDLDDDSELKHKLAKQYVYRYFTEIPYEAKANEYALIRIREMMNLLNEI